MTTATAVETVTAVATAVETKTAKPSKKEVKPVKPVVKQEAKFTMTGAEFKQVQAMVKQVVPKKSSNAVLEHARLSVNAGSIQFSATDLDQYTELTFDHSREDETVNTLIHYKALASVKCKATDILTIWAEVGRTTINGITYISEGDSEDYPHAPWDTSLLKAVDLHPDYFKELEVAAQYTSNEEVRPVLQCVEHKDGVLTATDSHRLVRIEKSHELEDFLLNGYHAITVVRLFGKTQRVVGHVDSKNGWYYLTRENIKYMGRIYDGVYPNVERIIPTTSKFEISVEVDAWVDRHDYLKPAVRDNDSHTVITTFNANSVHHLGKSDNARAQQEAPVKYLSGTPDMLKMGYNNDYMIQALSSFKALGVKYVPMAVTGATSPFRFHERRMTVIVLPVRFG